MKGGGFHTGRVVLRSYNNANSQGGVACANCNNDSSNTNTNNGSRLAYITFPKRKLIGLGNGDVFVTAIPRKPSPTKPYAVMEVKNTRLGVVRSVA